MKITNYKLQITKKIKYQILNIKKFVVWYLGIGIFLLFGAWNLVLAQSFSLSITPPLLEVMMIPGKTITQVYRLANQGATSLIYSQIVAFEPADDLGNINLELGSQLPASSNQQFLSWFSWQNVDITLPGTFLVKSGETQELVLRLQVPKDAEEKDYYTSLVFSVNPKGHLVSTTGTQAAGMLAANILLTVSKDGNPPKNGKIIDFSVPEFSLFNLKFRLFDSFDKIPFTLKVANTGQSLFKPQGSVKIISPSDKEVEFLEIAVQNILARSQRKLYIVGNEETPLKEISWQPRGLKIGRYKALANLVIDDSNIKMENTISFFMFPWKASLGLVVAYILLRLIGRLIIPKK